MFKKILIAFIILFGLYYIFLFSHIPESLQLIFKVIPMLLMIILAAIQKPVHKKISTIDYYRSSILYDWRLYIAMVFNWAN